MVLDDMAVYGTSGGLGTHGTDMFTGSFKEVPDEAMCFYEAGGLPPVHTMGNVPGRAALETVTLQVVHRARTYAVARANCQKSYLLFDGFPKRTINGVQYHYGKTRQPPFLMGLDESKRFLVGFNVDIMKEMSTTS